MDTASVIQRAYAQLGRLTPIPADCGALCGRQCCKGGDDDGMILFPGEEVLPVSFSVSHKEIDECPVQFAVCSGHCKRETRPLSCRVYPFAPCWDSDGTLTIIPDPRAVYFCPLLSEQALPLIDARFLRAAKSAFSSFWDVAEMRPMLRAYSKMLMEYKRFTG